MTIDAIHPVLAAPQWDALEILPKIINGYTIVVDAKKMGCEQAYYLEPVWSRVRFRNPVDCSASQFEYVNGTASEWVDKREIERTHYCTTSGHRHLLWQSDEHQCSGLIDPNMFMLCAVAIHSKEDQDREVCIQTSQKTVYRGHMNTEGFAWIGPLLLVPHVQLSIRTLKHLLDRSTEVSIYGWHLRPLC